MIDVKGLTEAELREIAALVQADNLDKWTAYRYLPRLLATVEAMQGQLRKCQVKTDGYREAAVALENERDAARAALADREREAHEMWLRALGMPYPLSASVHLRQADVDKAVARVLAEATQTAAWVVANVDGDNYRRMEQGMPVWTTFLDKAIWFTRRADAEQFAAEDEDAWKILNVAALLAPSGEQEPPR